MMDISDRGALFLASVEGAVPGPYLDGGSVWTYGIGHTAAAGPPIPAHMPRGNPADPEKELKRVFEIYKKDLRKYVEDVNEAFTASLSQYQFDAAVSFHYNTGGIRSAHWVESYNSGDGQKAVKEIMNWATPPSITGRRRKEQKLFATGDYGIMTVPVWSIRNNKPSGITATLTENDFMKYYGGKTKALSIWDCLRGLF